MKVIFLDFDGVINNWDNFDMVDINNVEILLKIINITGAKIVATTSNKYSFQVYGKKYEETTYFEYINILRKYGVEIFDVTPFVGMNRKAEIMAYLDNHPEIEEFLIFDDDYFIDGLLEHKVFLDLYNGIREEHVEPAVNILNGKLGFYPPSINLKETAEERFIRINEYHTLRKKKEI